MRTTSMMKLAVVLVLGLACGDPAATSNPPPPPSPPPLPGPPASVAVSPPTALIGITETVDFVAVVRDAAGKAISAPVTWNSSATAVATVNAGTVTGVTAGQSTITATAGTVSDQAVVTVTAAPSQGPMQLSFSTFLGGGNDELARDIAFDGAGNLYVAGNTRSSDFPTTASAFDPTYNTGGAQVSDAFIAKFSPSGTLLWSTYVGGPNYERAYAIEVAPDGDVVIAGRGGAGLPGLANTFQPVFAGGTGPNGAYGLQDGFVCRLAGNGGALRWCSYFGVDDEHIVRDMAVDLNGDIYLGAGTDKGGFPASWFAGTVQPTKSAGFDAVVAKVAGDGSRVIWATYVGGSGSEGGAPSIRVDQQGNVVVLIDTSSPDLPTVNAADPTFGGQRDFYVVKLSPDGRSRIFATYLGGSGFEVTETHGLWIDLAGNVIVAGETGSPDLATTANAYQRQNGGGGKNDGLIAKLDPTGTLLGMTYLGGTGREMLEGVSTDPQGNVYLSFSTEGPFPTTTGQGPGGIRDAVAVKLSADLSTLAFARRFGGNGLDQGRACAVDLLGNFVQVGTTRSTNWPTKNPFQASYQGGIDDAFVIRLTP